MRSWTSATATDNPAIVFVPELERWLSVSPGPYKALARVQRGGVHDKASEDGFAGQWLVDQPIAPAPLWRALSGNLSPDQVLINVGLVALRPDLNAVWASPVEHPVSSEVFALIDEVLQSSGVTLFEDAHGAYAVLPSAPEARFQPIWALDGVSLDALMPSGRDAAQWIRLISESQIVLHQYAQQAGVDETAPQGVWFWGAGSMPSPDQLTPRVSTVVAQSPEMIGLARALGLDRKSGLDQQSGPNQTHANPPAIGAIKPGELVEFAPPESASAEVALHALDDALSRALRRLAMGRLSRLELATREQRWAITPGAVWRDWLGLKGA